VISNNEGFSPYIPNCNEYSDMNAYVCENSDIGLLMFESQDADKYDRAVAPVYIANEGTSINTTINSFMDHIWDGFYTGQVRLSAFPSLILAPQGEDTVTEITMTGSPPNKMKFNLYEQGAGTSLGTTIRIAYPDAGSKAVYKDGTLVEPNAWDDDIPGYGPVLQDFCGENRYIGIQNILEFYITSGCQLEIRPRNAVATMVRMDFTLESFFSGGGTTNFVDRLSSSLGIHASDVKIVSVYEGSLVVNYELTTSDDDPETLLALEASQNTLLSSSDVDLGAPVLEHESSTRVDQDRTFTDAEHEVYEIQTDSNID